MHLVLLQAFRHPILVSYQFYVEMQESWKWTAHIMP
jgi:hypothetical protein